MRSRTVCWTNMVKFRQPMATHIRLPEGWTARQILDPSSRSSSAPFASSRSNPTRCCRHANAADGDCQDARNEPLIAESLGTVSYRSDRQCRVEAGDWLAPYTDAVVTDPSKLDVDHMVPLGNAHLSGAWHWSAEQRQRYANCLDDPQHLIAVTASTNRS